MEIQQNLSGALPEEGKQFTELDSDWYMNPSGFPASVNISQAIATIPGNNYTLIFYFSARPDYNAASNNNLSVMVNGKQVMDVWTSRTTWAQYNYTFNATSNSTIIGFADLGTPDSTGTLLDNVSLMCNPQPAPINASLTVKKILNNSNGGTASVSSFSFKVSGFNGGNPIFFNQINSTYGMNILSLAAGTYNVTEISASGYSTTYSGCTNVVLSNGGNATCTITNSAEPGTLIVKKIINNSNEGTVNVSHFSFSVNGGTPVSFIRINATNGQNTCLSLRAPTT
jgi:hypothetical protein